jgi:hypothetical protein
MAQIYILAFHGNTLLVNSNDNSNPPNDSTLNLIHINTGADDDANKRATVNQLTNLGFMDVATNLIFLNNVTLPDLLGRAVPGAGSKFAIYIAPSVPAPLISYNPLNYPMFVQIPTREVKFVNDSKFIVDNPNGNLLPYIAAFKAAAIAAIAPPPAPTPSPKKFRLIRFLPPFFFPPPFIGPPLLSPFAPYGNSVIRTPVGSPFFRLPGLSLPPDFVPAVIPTVRQPMLSPFGNPFPTRVREPSPVYRNLFEEKSRPAHMRSPRFKMDGGYYSKYLKYKNKYLELKNQLENQV